MVRRIALMLRIEPQRDARTVALRLSNVQTQRELAVERRCSLVLTLEQEPDVSFVRGHIRFLGNDVQFPIQSSGALFDALACYVAGSQEKQ